MGSIVSSYPDSGQDNALKQATTASRHILYN